MYKTNHVISGFTLVELMLTVAIIGIVLGIGLPSFQSMMINNRLTAQANSLVGALNLARSESIKRNKLVVVGKTGTNWKDGWEVFQDLNADGSSTGEEVFHTYEAISSNDLKFSFFPTSKFISYRPDGRSDHNGSFFLCSPASEAKFKRIVLSTSGRIRTENQDTATDSKTYANDCT